MLRVELSGADLEQVRVATRPAPLLELRTLLHRRTRPCTSNEPAVDPAEVELVRALVAQPCAPGFLLPAISDLDEAIETVSGARRSVIRRDLEDNASSGYPLPRWTDDLARPGHGGITSRQALRDALAHVASASVEPHLRAASARTTARTTRWRGTSAERGAPAMLDSMHPGIRCRASELEVDLASGTEVEHAASGAGILVVPTLSHRPGVTLSSDGQTPIVLTCPVRPRLRSQDDGASGDHPLDELIGTTRSMLLAVIADHPELGTRDLARRTGLAPASVSEHTQILRRAGLTEADRRGSRVVHRLTPLGWSLLVRWSA